jgi:hypothetical protein
VVTALTEVVKFGLVLVVGGGCSLAVVVFEKLTACMAFWGVAK